MHINDKNLAEFQRLITNDNLMQNNVNEPSQNYTCLLTKIKQKLKQACSVPSRPFNNKISPKAPWCTPYLADACKYKTQLYKNFLLCKTTETEQRYKEYRNFLNRFIKETKENYYKTCLNKIKHDSRKVWQIFKQNFKLQKTTPCSNGTNLGRAGHHGLCTLKCCKYT